MNFFEQQDIARRNTRLLVVLFVVAVIALIVLTLTFLVLFPWQTNARSFNQGSNEPLMCLMQQGCDFWNSVLAHTDKLITVTLAVLVVIGGASFYKWASLRQGGRVIAEMLNGREVKSNTRNLAEQRLLNVVEEMALAANMPVPAVYVLDGEMGINAFAAGFSNKDAVISVTEGALQSFNRDQLQGVIAHEFSHILNGDMRLNMKIIAMLYGIMFISQMGYLFLRSSSYSSSRERKTGLEMLLGLGLVIIGSIGTFFGYLIKAAVSRQREFLADASAVQFTRSASGIADALKVIGGHAEGSAVLDSHGGEISHLFFSEAVSRLQSFFATHPPLSDRIRRIEPRWNGVFLQATVQYDAEPIAEEKPPIDFDHTIMGAAALVAAVTEAYKPQPGSRDELHEPLGAAAAISCLLLQTETTVRAKQIEAVQTLWPALYPYIEKSTWNNAAREDFLAVVELSTSALRMLTVDEYKQFKQLLLLLMKADGTIDVYEWSLYYLLKSTVDHYFGQTIFPKPSYKKPTELEQELRIIFTMMIQSTAQNAECKARAMERALAICDLPFDASAIFPEASMAEFTSAMRKLANAYPLLKARIVKALINAAKSDGELEPVERYIIKAIAAAIDTPVLNIDMPELM